MERFGNASVMQSFSDGEGVGSDYVTERGSEVLLWPELMWGESEVFGSKPRWNC